MNRRRLVLALASVAASVAASATLVACLRDLTGARIESGTLGGDVEAGAAPDANARGIADAGTPLRVSLARTDLARYAPGATIAASAILSDDGTEPVALRSLTLSARLRQDGRALGTFLPGAAPLTLGPGTSFTLEGTLPIPSGAPEGTWEVYANAVDAAGAYVEGPAATITVAASDAGFVDGVQMPVTDRTTYAPGDTITANASLRNDTGASMTTRLFLLTARQPGTTHASGPFDDFLPNKGSQVLAPGDVEFLSASYVLAADAPEGTWEIYATWEGTGYEYHDGPSAYVTVRR